MHLLLDISTSSPRLTSIKEIASLLLDISNVCELAIRDMDLKEFPSTEPSGPGITGYMMLSESHCNIDTWPEKGLVQLCLHSCKRLDVDAVKRVLERVFGPYLVKYEQCLDR